MKQMKPWMFDLPNKYNTLPIIIRTSFSAIAGFEDLTREHGYEDAACILIARAQDERGYWNMFDIRWLDMDDEERIAYYMGRTFAKVQDLLDDVEKGGTVVVWKGQFYEDMISEIMMWWYDELQRGRSRSDDSLVEITVSYPAWWRRTIEGNKGENWISIDLLPKKKKRSFRR